MILGFKTTHPTTKEPTYFVDKIQECFMRPQSIWAKKHSFRIGDRWRPGIIIHFSTGVRTPKYHCWHKAPVVSVQTTMIKLGYGPKAPLLISIETNGVWTELYPYERLEYAVNDGFESLEEMASWFFPKGKDSKDKVLLGQTIHWTDKQY